RAKEAFEQWDEAVRVKPDWEQPRYNRALALSSQGRTAEAIAEYEALLRIRPDFTLAHVNVGNLLRSDGKAKEAEDHFRIALELAAANGQTDLVRQIQQQLGSIPSAPHEPISP